jgi:hypothetical protein
VRELDVDVVAPVLDVADREQREPGTPLGLPQRLGKAAFIGRCFATKAAPGRTR